MRKLDNVTLEQIDKFISSLNAEELKYYDIQNDRILDTVIYVKGAYRDGELAGIGGIATWYRLFPHCFYMIKQSHQSQGIGSEFADACISYAKGRLPFIVGSSKIENGRSIKIVKNRGYEKVWETHEDFYSILLLNIRYRWVKRFLQIAVPLYHSPLGYLIKPLKKIRRLRL